MNTRYVAILIVAVLAVAGVAACVALDNGGSEKDINTSGQMVTDAVGRKVIVPDDLNGGIITIGSSGPLRFLSCFDVFDKIVETDKGDVTDNRNGRAYSYAYDYASLKSFHADNSLDTETVESIAKKNPSLIVVQESVWRSYTENCEVLAKNCTMVVIKAQSMTTMWDDNYDLSPDMKFNFNMLGKMLGMEKRAAQLIDDIGGLIKDVHNLKGNSQDSVYVAGVTISGSNTLNTTFPVYMPLTLTDGKNAYNGTMTSPKVTLNIEEFAKMKIDKMIIDPSSSDKMAEVDSQLVLKYIYGINNDANKDNDVDMFVTIPIVWDSINYDCVLASAYYVAYLQNGELTHDQVVEKINNVFKVFYGDHGKDVLKDMTAFFEKKSAANSVELPLLSAVKINFDGNRYTVTSA